MPKTVMHYLRQQRLQLLGKHGRLLSDLLVWGVCKAVSSR
jgi:hypothetical protein